MGHLSEGIWYDNNDDVKIADDGTFIRPDSRIRNWITADGSAGPTGKAGYKAEKGRYHLYVSYACPWAHRTLIYRTLKGLEDSIDVSVVHWYMAENGWTFDAKGDDAVKDNLFSSEYLHQLYTKNDANHSGRVTVPILWDKATNSIVSNESSEIIRMFNFAFNEAGANHNNYYPAELAAEIDSLNERIYDTVNNGVYKTGMAFTQQSYDSNVAELFSTLDWLDERLSSQRFLTGNEPVEADWRLLPTLLRFDLIYHGHFKCNMKRISDYENLWPYARDLYQHGGVAKTCNFEHMRNHYYASHDFINPTRIVAAGPTLDWSAPHDRDQG